MRGGRLPDPPRPEQVTSPAVAVVGPTASGKSELALRIAQRHGGEVVNFDSVQVYRRFDIGSAKLPPDERQGVPHHLLDCVGPERDYSAGDYSRDAAAVVADLRSRGVLPVLAGGTGFYLEALCRGLFPAPATDPRLRARLQEVAGRRPRGHLWRVLERLDAKAAATIHANDTQKLIRAVEVCLLGKRPMTEQWDAPSSGLADFRFLHLGLAPPREQLYARINLRARRMFEEGLLEEIERLLRQGVPRTAKPFGALGYRQGLAVLDGECTLQEAVEATMVRTRQYAKRQLTWFRRRTPGLRWIHHFGSSEEAWRIADEEVLGWL